jgi:hypothetical protein
MARQELRVFPDRAPGQHPAAWLNIKSLAQYKIPWPAKDTKILGFSWKNDEKWLVDVGCILVLAGKTIKKHEKTSQVSDGNPCNMLSFRWKNPLKSVVLVGTSATLSHRLEFFGAKSLI